jgi:hypothetical protein
MEGGHPSATALVRVLTSEMISMTLLSGFAAAVKVGVARLEAARHTGDDYELCRALAGLASLQINVGGDARGLAEEAVEIARRIGNPLALSSSLYSLAQVTLPIESERAIALLEEAETFARGNVRLLTILQGVQAQLLSSGGDLRGVADIVARAVELEWSTRHRLDYSTANLRILMGALAAHGRLEDAAVIDGACSRDINVHPPEGLRDGLAPNRYAELRARGAAMEEKEIAEFIRWLAGSISA